jgi:hypothetical protein
MVVGTLGSDNKKAPDSHWKRPQKTNVKTPHVVHELPVIGYLYLILGLRMVTWKFVPFSSILFSFQILCCNFNFNPPKTKIPKKIMKQAKP